MYESDTLSENVAYHMQVYVVQVVSGGSAYSIV